MDGIGTILSEGPRFLYRIPRPSWELGSSVFTVHLTAVTAARPGCTPRHVSDSPRPDGALGCRSESSRRARPWPPARWSRLSGTPLRTSPCATPTLQRCCRCRAPCRPSMPMLTWCRSRSPMKASPPWSVLKTSGFPLLNACSKASTQKPASRVLDRLQATTYRLYQSMIAPGRGSP